MKLTRAELKNELENVGIRASAQRIAILGFMRENPVHPTAETVYESLCEEIGSLSLTTVYNTLKLFVDKGLISMLTIDDTFRCFDGNIKMHAHFLCKKCKSIYDLRMPEGVDELFDELKGFETDEAQLYLKGICEKCKVVKTDNC